MPHVEQVKRYIHDKAEHHKNTFEENFWIC